MSAYFIMLALVFLAIINPSTCQWTTTGRFSHLTTSRPWSSSGRCEHITVDTCKDVEYERTVMPNTFRHRSQEDAADEMDQFMPLVRRRCSPHIRFFLCAMFIPKCIIGDDQPLKPCRSVCLAVENDCSTLLDRFARGWSNSFDCSTLPIGGDCITPRNFDDRFDSRNNGDDFFDDRQNNNRRTTSSIRDNIRSALGIH